MKGDKLTAAEREKLSKVSRRWARRAMVCGWITLGLLATAIWFGDGRLYAFTVLAGLVALMYALLPNALKSKTILDGLAESARNKDRVKAEQQAEQERLERELGLRQ